MTKPGIICESVSCRSRTRLLLRVSGRCNLSDTFSVSIDLWTQDLGSPIRYLEDLQASHGYIKGPLTQFWPMWPSQLSQSMTS
jgi:hypothetical protein